VVIEFLTIAGLTWIAFSGTQVLAGPPTWTKQDTLVRNGNDLIVVCHSEAVSADLAHEAALASCTHRASSQVQTSFSVNSVSVETDQDASYHREIAARQVISGLTCKPLAEHIEDSGQPVQFWIKCRYDLSKITVAEASEKKKSKPGDIAKGDDKSSSLVENRGEINSLLAPGQTDKYQRQEVQVSKIRQLLLTSVPACQSVLIRGKRPRSIQCKSNPQALQILEDDSELIVRAAKHLPKHIQLKSDRQPASSPMERLEVYLDAAN
jgi:hypothetical protein